MVCGDCKNGYHDECPTSRNLDKTWCDCQHRVVEDGVPECTHGKMVSIVDKDLMRLPRGE